MNSQLILEKLSLKVKLGYSAEERSIAQWVSVKITLNFVKPPMGCFNDKLSDSFCYATLSDELQNFCDKYSFKLIESLAYQLHQFIKNRLSELKNEKIGVSVCVTKNPKLSQLEQASFLISD